MQNALGYHGDRGLFSSLVDWIAGNATPSFIEGQSLSAEVCALKASGSEIKKYFHECLSCDGFLNVMFVGLVCLAGAEYGGCV